MAEKTTHFGRAGEYFAMSELLLRGWNVAVPVVDLGDDVFVIDDNDKTTYRVQVKSGDEGGQVDAPSFSFNLSRSQLRAAGKIELFYMLVARRSSNWRFLVIPRYELELLRDRFEAADRTGPGRRPVPDSQAKTDAVQINVTLTDSGASAWGGTLDKYLDKWPSELEAITTGPGARGK
jgi:hypothetical protein